MKPTMLKLGDDYVNMANVLDVCRERAQRNSFDYEVDLTIPPPEGIRVNFVNGQTRHYTGPESWERYLAWLEKEAQVVDMGPITAKR